MQSLVIGQAAQADCGGRVIERVREMPTEMGKRAIGYRESLSWQRFRSQTSHGLKYRWLRKLTLVPLS